MGWSNYSIRLDKLPDAPRTEVEKQVPNVMKANFYWLYCALLDVHLSLLVLQGLISIRLEYGKAAILE